MLSPFERIYTNQAGLGRVHISDGHRTQAGGIAFRCGCEVEGVVSSKCARLRKCQERQGAPRNDKGLPEGSPTDPVIPASTLNPLFPPRTASAS
jgi:hypothetical protein